MIATGRHQRDDSAFLLHHQSAEKLDEVCRSLYVAGSAGVLKAEYHGFDYVLHPASSVSRPLKTRLPPMLPSPTDAHTITLNQVSIDQVPDNHHSTDQPEP